MAIQQILHAGRYGGIDLGYCIQPSDVPQTLPHFRPPKVMTKERDPRLHPPARRGRAAGDSGRLRRHRGHQLHGLPARQLQLALHQPAHRRIRRLDRKPRPVHARADRRHQAGDARQSAGGPPERRRADGPMGRQHRGRVLRADAAGCRRRRGHDQRHRRLAGGAGIVDRPRHPAGLLELPLRAGQEDCSRTP